VDASPTDPTAAQLAVFVELNAVLASAGVRFWLRGGWAVDFLLGAVTRSHADVDAVDGCGTAGASVGP
jgi:hypothetical protein